MRLPKKPEPFRFLLSSPCSGHSCSSLYEKENGSAAGGQEGKQEPYHESACTGLRAGPVTNCRSRGCGGGSDPLLLPPEARDSSESEASHHVTPGAPAITTIPYESGSWRMCHNPVFWYTVSQGRGRRGTPTVDRRNYLKNSQIKRGGDGVHALAASGGATGCDTPAMERAVPGFRTVKESPKGDPRPL
jgi:hypothetical protein